MTSKTTHIYGPSFSNFVRTVMLVCEEKKIPYTVGIEVNGETIGFKSERHLELHPFGKMPILIQDQLILPETSSICRYLDNDRELQPHDSIEYAAHDALCALISIDIDKVLLRDYLLEFAFPQGENGTVRVDVVNQVKPKVISMLTTIDKILHNKTALSTDTFTIADALLAPMLHYISCLPTDYNLLTGFPNLTRYLDKLMTRASCQKVLIKKDFA